MAKKVIGFRPKGLQIIESPNLEFNQADWVWLAVCVDRLIRVHQAELLKSALPAEEKQETRRALKELQSVYQKIQNKLHPFNV